MTKAEINPKKIPEEKYKEILELLPVCCADVIIKKGKKILLVMRKNEPLKEKFWLPGGRIYKNEKSEDAAVRKALEECGLNVKIEKKIGSYDLMEEVGPFDDLKGGVHTVGIVFLASITKNNQPIVLDSQSLHYKWVDKSDKTLDPRLYSLLEELRIF